MPSESDLVLGQFARVRDLKGKNRKLNGKVVMVAGRSAESDDFEVVASRGFPDALVRAENLVLHSFSDKPATAFQLWPAFGGNAEDSDDL